VKKIIICFFAFVSFILIPILFIYTPKNESKLSDKIIEYIDKNCDENNTCKISISDITNFKWDKMLMYQVGSSNTEISKLIGTEFKDDLDLTSGLIFVYNNKIVYKEQIPYNPDKPNKLLLYIGILYGQPEYGTFTPSNAILEGTRREENGKIYYAIAPFYVK
jgi:hypothetical protein